MGIVKSIAKRSFGKIFKNLSADLDCPISDVKIGITFKDGVHAFGAYKGRDFVKGIKLDDYVGSVVDFSGGTSVVETTIAQSGPRYAKECEASIDDIEIIMQNNDNSLPDAVLLCMNKKIRRIDIEKEFLR